MITLFLLAGLVSAALIGLAVLALVAGLGLWLFGRPEVRGFAAYVGLVPALTALTAVGGAWGCGAALTRMTGSATLPVWGWLGGLVLGGLLGACVGLVAAYSLARRTLHAKSEPPRWVEAR